MFSMHLDLEFEDFGCLRLYLWVEHNQLSSNIQRETGTQHDVFLERVPTGCVPHSHLKRTENLMN